MDPAVFRKATAKSIKITDAYDVAAFYMVWFCLKSKGFLCWFSRTQMQKVVRRRKRRKKRNTRKRRNTRSIRNRKRKRVEKKRVEWWQEDTDRKQSQILIRKR